MLTFKQLDFSKLLFLGLSINGDEQHRIPSISGGTLDSALDSAVRQLKEEESPIREIGELLHFSTTETGLVCMELQDMVNYSYNIGILDADRRSRSNYCPLSEACQRRMYDDTITKTQKNPRGLRDIETIRRLIEKTAENLKESCAETGRIASSSYSLAGNI